MFAGAVQVQKEEEQHGDLAFLAEKTNYKSILFKTFFIFQYAAEHYDFRYVLKTDDDTFVNVSLCNVRVMVVPLPDTRRALAGGPCSHADCTL